MDGHTRKSSRQPRPNKKHDSSSSDDDDASIDTPPAKATSTKRKSKADVNSSSKSAKTTTMTTHASTTTEEDKTRNKTLFNEFNLGALNVTNVGDIGHKFRKEFGGESCDDDAALDASSANSALCVSHCCCVFNSSNRTNSFACVHS